MTKDPKSEFADPDSARLGGRPLAFAGVAADDRSFFGHPRGLMVLFFTEMWERFSYYGMRALLILFMTAAIVEANPGLGFGVGRAAAIYGLYTSMVYLLALPGGWVADNLWGQRKAVFVGGVIIAMGHFTLAAPLVGVPDIPSFFLGLFFIVIGTGLLKPNVSTMVGDLYANPQDARTEHERDEWGARRDAAFSLFYMGINIGAVLGPFICGTLGEEVNWHWGFSAAGFGMILGLIQYRMGDRHLGNAGALRGDPASQEVRDRTRRFYLTAGGVAGAAALFIWLSVSGILPVTLQGFATWLGYGILLLTITFFAWLIFGLGLAAGLLLLWAILIPLLGATGDATVAAQWATVSTLGVFLVVMLASVLRGGERNTIERKRLMVIFWLFLLAAVFWSGFEQAGSSMNLFAEDLTDRVFFGWQMPTTWLQNVNPFFIIILAPVFGAMWQWLARRDRNPSIPVKFGLGLLGLAAGFFVLSWGASYATDATRVSVVWLVVTYFFHTCGELALSPVGLSSMTKLAPPDRVGQMMGVWFIAAALGNLFAGLVAGNLEVLPPSDLFRSVAMFAGAAGLVALFVSPWVKRLTGGIQ
ncbi:MAG TPA: peptide MFS transporter [Longimicrobiales bacterium]|nr:peptide MFS transporter [Longimicrobiales bacterium]